MNESLELNVDANKIDTKNLENKLLNDEKITEETVEKSLDYNSLSEEEKQLIDSFTQKIDITNTNLILQYGASAQTKIAKFSDNVLENVKTKSTGEIGDLLTSLVAEIKDFNTDVPEEKKGLLAIFNSAKRQMSRLLLKYDKVENNVCKVEKELEAHKIQMLKDISIYDVMYEKNLEYFKELSLYIIAGEKKLDELKNSTLVELRKKAEETKEQMDVQAVNDMSNTINRFEKKLYDLKTTRVISIQMAPQIRLIQNNDSELVEKIQSSLVNTIPLWKSQIVIALGINNAKNALNAQKEVTNMTNEMLKKNSEMLKQGTIEVAKESERSIVDIETLQKTNQDIIDTLDSIVKIHKEGAEKREKAEIELNRIESELKEKILEISE